jgi:hypothetical protein
MLTFLQPQAVVIGSVTLAEEAATQDSELKVEVDGQPKTCRGFISRNGGLPHIRCNVERFKATGAPEQYRLIHHEYAGLAGVERNTGAASDYTISQQLTDFLVPETILRLSINKRVDTKRAGYSNLVAGDPGCSANLYVDISERAVVIRTYDSDTVLGDMISRTYEAGSQSDGYGANSENWKSYPYYAQRTYESNVLSKSKKTTRIEAGHITIGEKVSFIDTHSSMWSGPLALPFYSKSQVSNRSIEIEKLAADNIRYTLTEKAEWKIRHDPAGGKHEMTISCEYRDPAARF